MMKWKAKKETLNIGEMKLDNLTFNEDYMELSIDIFEISEELQTEINKSIEIAKVEEIEKWEKIHGEYAAISMDDKKWSDKPVIIQFNYLRIVWKMESLTVIQLLQVLKMQKMRGWKQQHIQQLIYRNTATS